MRALALVIALAGCGSTVRPPPPTDDLDVGGALRPEVKEPEAPVAAAPIDAGADPSVSVEVVDSDAPDADGPRIDLAVRDADVADVMRMIAAAAKIGIVVTDDVDARVTLEVRHVTWRQAIDVIAQLEGLDVIEERGIVTVTRKSP